MKYILVKVFKMSDSMIETTEALDEALEEYGCEAFMLGQDSYMVTSSTTGGLTALGNDIEDYKGVVVEVKSWIGGL